MTDHNAYDVVRIFQLGWPHMGEAERAQASAAIARLLDWSLTESLQPDGAFAAPAGFSSSVSDAQYYGVSLLTKAGYCSTSRRSGPTAAGRRPGRPAAGSPSACEASAPRSPRPRPRGAAWRKPIRPAGLQRREAADDLQRRPASVPTRIGGAGRAGGLKRSRQRSSCRSRLSAMPARLPSIAVALRSG